MTLRVGIVGCGRISDLHAMGYEGLTGARIMAVCDTSRRRARAQARAWGVEKVFTDFNQMLADPEIDLVELLVPHRLHARMAVQACQAGKHVSVQKPMAMTVAEADEMIAAADRAGVVLRVYENFVFYPPFVRASELLAAGEIGEPQMLRIHFSTGRSDTAWKVPASAWLWRLREEKASGGLLVFDHGYHLFSMARALMGEAEKVSAWIDHSPAGKGLPERLVQVDAPATVMVKFKEARRYGVMDFSHTPDTELDSSYYADDNRVEIIGERGRLLVNRCTARSLDLPPLVMFRDGQTRAIPVERAAWHDSFIDCTRHLVEVLARGGDPILDGAAGRAVLQFALAAQISSREGREVRPDEVK